MLFPCVSVVPIKNEFPKVAFVIEENLPPPFNSGMFIVVFVLIFGAVLLGAFSMLVGALSLFIARFFVKEPNRTRKLFLAFFIPIFVMFSFPVTFGAGNAVVASFVGTDIGVGDWFYVNVSRNYSLCFVDTTEYGGHIGSSAGGVPLVPDVVEICERGNVLLGKLENGKFFSFNTESEKPEIYADKPALIAAVPEAKGAELVPAGDFYYQKAGDLHGMWRYAVPLLSAVLITATTIGICRFVLRKRPTTNPQP